MHRFKRVPLSVALGSLFLSGALVSPAVLADVMPQTLPFAQDWSNTSLITANDDWSGVPGITGYLGDTLTSANDVDARTVLGFGTGTLDAIADQTATSLTAGGVAEFHLTDPVVALQGSGTADAPFLLIALNTTGKNGITVAYTLRDLDSAADNAAQQIALQYRVGSVGNFTDVPAAYVADATEGPSLSGKTTPVSVTLPAAADNQSLVQVRFITTNASGSDEWVGIDNIAIDGSAGAPGNASIVTTCPASLPVVAGGAASVVLSASDADSLVNAAVITSGAVAGISLGTVTPALLDGASASVSLDVSGLAAGTYPVTIRFDNNDAQNAACTVSVIVSGITTIPQIQGNGSSSPLAGQSVTTEGVVTKLNNNGFYLQDETGDNDAATSDGVFVFTSTAPTVSVGDRVRLTAKVVEFNTGAAGNATTLANPLTELTTVSGLTVLASGLAIAPTPIAFPETTEGDLERVEGMLVEIATPLTAAQNFFQGRFGQVTLAAEGRLIKPTNLYQAGTPEALALAGDNARRRIILDDGTSLQNTNPTAYIGDDNTLRAGDTLPGLVGVIDYGLATSSNMGLGDYRIHPVGAVNFTRANPRTATPTAVGGNVRVASFNVLNYFTTFVDGTTADGQSGQGCTLGGATSASNCRGANNLAEFNRQRDKIVAAITAINADVIGLMEVQNNGNAAVNNLTGALNAAMGAGTYASVAMPVGGTGSDAIRVAMIYKPAKLLPVGSAQSDTDAIHSRPPLAQVFEAANGERFALVVNHFKSKGSCPSAGDPNADQGDGQGCWNALRVEQAQALASFVAGVDDASAERALVIGDLNAYGREEPVIALLNQGYADQISRFNGEAGYSFVFDGEAGYLDHALATPFLASNVSGAIEWHINADEPSIIDYNTEFKQPACATCGPDYYTATAYRSSDHDPVVVGLSLLKSLTGTAGRDVINGTPGDDVISGGIGADTISSGAGSDVIVYGSMRDAGDSVTDFAPGLDRLDLSALLASLGINQATAFANGHVRVVAVSGGASVQIDADGATGAGVYRPLATLKGVNATAIDPLRDLGL
jgi:predicted extracellular nuclease